MIGELLYAPGIHDSVSARSAKVVTWTFETGPGRSCTETVTVPQA